MLSRFFGPVTCCATAHACAVAWKQDRFLISFWVDPIVNVSEYPVEYARIREANFNVLLGGFGATDPASVRAQVAACEGAGLACVPSSCESPSGPNPSGSCVGVASPVWGYQMYDEPQPSEFPALAAWAASVAARAPGTLRFINLLPNYGFPPPSAAVYAEYLASFVSTVHPDALCFDHYPLFSAPPDDDTSPAGYLRNLAAVAAAARNASLPFFNFFGAMPYNGRPDVSEAQLRWQALSSVAHGSRGLLYFCYWTPVGTSFLWGGGIMTPRALPPDGPVVYSPGPKYAQATRLNAQLAAYGAFLLPATASPAGPFAANGTGNASVSVPAGQGGGVTAVGGSGAGPTWTLLLGAFAAPFSTTLLAGAITAAAAATGGVPAPAPAFSSAALLQNQDWGTPLLATLEFAGGDGAAWEVDGAGGAASPALDDAPALPGFQLLVEPGGARLLAFV